MYQVQCGMRKVLGLVWLVGCHSGLSTAPAKTGSASQAAVVAFAVDVTIVGNGRVSSFPIGIDCGGSCHATVSTGDSIALWAEPVPGNQVTWSDASCSGQLCVEAPTTNTSVTATFGPVTGLAVNLSGAGHGSVKSDVGGVDCHEDGGVCTIALPPAQQVTLTATADAGFFFGSWRGACTGAGATCVVTGSASATTVTAVFSAVYYWDSQGGPGFIGSLWATGLHNERTTRLVGLQNVAIDLGSCAGQPSDGSAIALPSYVSLDGSDSVGTLSNLWVLDFVSHRLTPLTQFKTVAQTSGEFDATSGARPTFSPDTNFVAFASDQDVTQTTEAVGARNIWLAPRDGSAAPIALTHDTVAALVINECQSNFTFSPDGSQIAFLSTNAISGDPATVYANIWTVGTDGKSTPVRLTSYTSNSFQGITSFGSIAWSPKGDSIAFFAASNSVDSGNGVTNLQLIDVSTKAISPLTTYAGSVSFTTLAWDSAAAHLIFESSADTSGFNNGSENVHAIDADGLNDSVVIAGTFPELSPDGTQILYEAPVGSRSGIWRVATGASAVGAAITSDTDGGAGLFLIEDNDD